MLNKIKSFLLQPYPDDNDLKAFVRSSLLGGLIVFLILYLFRPFKIDNSPDLFKHALGFGLVTVAVSFVYDLILKYILKLRRDAESWVFWKWIVAVSILIFSVAIANYFYMIHITHWAHSVKVFKIMLSATMIVGIFPVIVFGGMNLIRNLKKNIAIAEKMKVPGLEKSEKPVIAFPLNKSGEIKELNAAKILYIESLQNYVQLVYLDGSEVKKEIIRSTMKSVEALIEGSSLRRSHRSFIVNEEKISGVRGNAQGLKLKLENLEEEIPVSRKYVPLFRKS